MQEASSLSALHEAAHKQARGVAASAALTTPATTDQTKCKEGSVSSEGRDSGPPLLPDAAGWFSDFDYTSPTRTISL